MQTNQRKEMGGAVAGTGEAVARGGGQDGGRASALHASGAQVPAGLPPRLPITLKFFDAYGHIMIRAAMNAGPVPDRFNMNDAPGSPPHGLGVSPHPGGA
ncbi:hypothetical protein OG394_03180 [Kribbella sp. NBC_01245]|uniref:hypothetical protein n=1 Tax=Kribbella sp. NBC_01245 TaxID=2903578 RepID=UPI002E2DF0A1|nr:hypothetical protein [Kribbella sp. NBC_01245]